MCLWTVLGFALPVCWLCDSSLRGRLLSLRSALPPSWVLQIERQDNVETLLSWAKNHQGHNAYIKLDYRLKLTMSHLSTGRQGWEFLLPLLSPGGRPTHLPVPVQTTHSAGSVQQEWLHKETETDEISLKNYMITNAKIMVAKTSLNAVIFDKIRKKKSCWECTWHLHLVSEGSFVFLSFLLHCKRKETVHSFINISCFFAHFSHQRLFKETLKAINIKDVLTHGFYHLISHPILWGHLD